MRRRFRRTEKIVVVVPRKAILLVGCDLSAEVGRRRKSMIVYREMKEDRFWG